MAEAINGCVETRRRHAFGLRKLITIASDTTDAEHSRCKSDECVTLMGRVTSSVVRRACRATGLSCGARVLDLPALSAR